MTPTIQQVLTKRSLGIKLNGLENQVWEAHLRTHLHKQREQITADHDGNVTIRRTQDVEPIMDGVKLMSEAQMHSPIRDSKGRLYLGSVDFITAMKWAKECGAPLGTKEWRAYAKKQLMSRDFAKFRAAPVRRVY